MSTTITTRDLITNAFKLAGVYQQGENLSAFDISQGRLALENMLDSWSNNPLLIYKFDQNVFSTTPGIGDYLLGASDNADWVMERPIEIVKMVSRQHAGTTNQLDLPINKATLEQWSTFPVKNSTSNLPHLYYDDRKFPDRTISLWPIPQETMQIVIWSYVTMVDLTNLDTVVMLPPGYKRMLEYGLAVEICPLFGKTVDSTLVSIARAAIEQISKTNSVEPVFHFDGGINGSSTTTSIPHWVVGSGYGIVR